MKNSNLELFQQFGIMHIDFVDSKVDSTDSDIAAYLGIDEIEYKNMLIKFGAYSKPHGKPYTFLLRVCEAEDALEWVQSIEMVNLLAKRV